MHTHNIRLCYGGGTSGMMGEVARTLVSLSGPSAVHGIIPSALQAYEQSGRDGTGTVQHAIDGSVYGTMTVVPDMHTRKKLMARAVMEGGPGSGFVALPGGYGTLEELMEMVTWNQLGIHGLGIVLLNVDGYWNGIVQWVRRSVSSAFVSPGNGGILVEALDSEEAVRCLREYRVSDDRLKLDWNQN
jgi:uncharacterized protein (TIGR00730 family)